MQRLPAAAWRRTKTDATVGATAANSLQRITMRDVNGPTQSVGTG